MGTSVLRSYTQDKWGLKYSDNTHTTNGDHSTQIIHIRQMGPRYSDHAHKTNVDLNIQIMHTRQMETFF